MERKKEIERERLGGGGGGNITKVYLKLAISLHVPSTDFRTFRFSPLKWSPLCGVKNWQPGHTFHCKKKIALINILPTLSICTRSDRRTDDN